MAEQKKTTTTKTTTRKNGIFGWGINKISFYTIGAAAILYLIGMILAACGVGLKVVSILQNLAAAIMVCIVAFLAWKYVRSKPTVWKVLYFVFLAIVLVGIIIPLVI